MLCNNPEGFDDLIADVLACFEECDGRLYNSRMESVRAEQIERKEKASEAGKIGAKKRWQTHSDPIANALQSDSPATATATATATAKNKPPAYKAIVSNYNSILGKKLPKAISINSKRKSLIRSIWRDNPDTMFFIKLFTKVKDIPFLMGDNDKGWMADLDFILRPDKVTKIMEGSYRSSSSRKEVLSSTVTKQKKDIDFTCPNHLDVSRLGARDLYCTCHYEECRTRLVDRKSLLYTDTINKASQHKS